MRKQIQKSLPNIPIMDISMRDYGTMNGKNVFLNALQILDHQKL